MPIKPIALNGKSVTLHKALKSPDFGQKTVLVRDHWEYVEMWLKRKKYDEANKYWSQAKHFYTASTHVPNVASPLTLHYSMLNAAKAFLMVKGIHFERKHGLQGWVGPGKTRLDNEQVKFQPKGLLSSLCDYFDEPCTGEEYSLKDLLYNLPFVHRCFQLTYPTGYPELYMPLAEPCFVTDDEKGEAWFTAEFAGTHDGRATDKCLERLGFVGSADADGRLQIKFGKPFDWDERKGNGNARALTDYHRSIRRHVHYVSGVSTLWYLKRNGVRRSIDRNPATIIFASMHRLSELARYQPIVLQRHLELDQNWLLSEFIRCAPFEFIDQIACEMTDQDFLLPAIRNNR